MDVDTRQLRSFLAVAQSGSETQAARRLLLPEPALAEEIGRLEGGLGVRLLIRTRAGVAPTVAGRVLARRVPGLLRDWERASRETRRAGDSAAQVLRVGSVLAAAQAVPGLVGAFEGWHPGWRLELRAASWGEPGAGLATGEVDAALVRLPFPGQQRLRIQALCAEERWVALPEQHPLAARQLIPSQDLWDEPFVAGPAECGVWREHWLAAEERGGRPVRVGAEARPGEDWLDAVAAGRGLALVPRALAGTVLPGVAFRPVRGLRPSTVALAWSPADDANPVVRDFVACCLSVRN